MLTNTLQAWVSRKLIPIFKDNADGTITLSVTTTDYLNTPVTGLSGIDKNRARCDSEIVYRIKRSDGSETAYGPLNFPYDKTIPKTDIGVLGAALIAEVVYYQAGSNDVPGTVFGTAIRVT